MQELDILQKIGTLNVGWAVILTCRGLSSKVVVARTVRFFTHGLKDHLKAFVTNILHIHPGSSNRKCPEVQEERDGQER